MLRYLAPSLPQSSSESTQLFSGYPAPELEKWNREQSKAPITGEIFTDLLHHLDIHKSMEPDGIYTKVLKELAEVLSEPLSIIYQQSWVTREVPVDQRWVNGMHSYKKLEGRSAELQACQPDPRA